MRCCTLRGRRATNSWGNQHRFQLSLVNPWQCFVCCEPGAGRCDHPSTSHRGIVQILCCRACVRLSYYEAGVSIRDEFFYVSTEHQTHVIGANVHVEHLFITMVIIGKDSYGRIDNNATTPDCDGISKWIPLYSADQQVCRFDVHLSLVIIFRSESQQLIRLLYLFHRFVVPKWNDIISKHSSQLASLLRGWFWYLHISVHFNAYAPSISHLFSCNLPRL